MYRVEIDLPVSGTRSFSKGSNLIEISDISRAIQPDKSFENSSVTVTFHSAFWNELMRSPDQYIVGASLRVYDDANLLFTGSVSDFPRCSRSRFVIKADTFNSGLSERINRTITKEEFPNVPGENSGKLGNIVINKADDSAGNGTGILTAYRVADNKFLAAWHHITSLVNAYDNNGNILSVSLDNNADGNSYINYTSEDKEIYFNCIGLQIDNPAEAFEYINTQFGNLSLNTDSFIEAKNTFTDRGYTDFVIAIDDEVTWSDFIQRFSVNFDCMVYPSVSGNLKIKVLNWGGETPKNTYKGIYK